MNIEIISFVIALSDRTKNNKMNFFNSNTSPPATGKIVWSEFWGENWKEN